MKLLDQLTTHVEKNWLDENFGRKEFLNKGALILIFPILGVNITSSAFLNNLKENQNITPTTDFPGRPFQLLHPTVHDNN